MLATLLVVTACADGPRSELEVAHEQADALEDSRHLEPSVPLPRPKPERPRRPAPSKSVAVAPAPVSIPPEAAVQDTWTADRLVGLTPAETEQHLGSPTFQEEAAPAKIWLYKTESCTFKLYFFPEVRSLVYRVLRYETVGDPDVDSETCVGEIRKAEKPTDRGDAQSRRTA